MNELDVVEVKRGLANMAELLAAYVKELRSQGFSRGEALQIAIGWQASLLTPKTNGES